MAIRPYNASLTLTVFCPHCGAQEPEGARFCAGCGAPLPAPPPPAKLFCPQCGAEQPPGAAFCSACGSSVGGVVPASSASRSPPAAPPPPVYSPGPAAPVTSLAQAEARTAYGAGPVIPAYAGIQAAPAQAETRVAYGGFWRRLVALLVDFILLAVVLVVLVLVFFDPKGSPEQMAWSTVLCLWVAIVLMFAYQVVGTGLWGRTLGKRLLGLRVVNAAGQPPGIGRALLREVIGKWLSGMVFYIGYLTVAGDARKQGWHDKIAGTTVVRG